jgi:hypothetical protein
LGEVSLELFAGPADERSFVPEPTEFGRPKLALTVEDLDQALARSEAAGGHNVGEECALGAVEMVGLLRGVRARMG